MIKVTLVRPSGCMHCGAVKEVLEGIKKDYPNLVIEEVEATSPEGIELIQKHGILSSPGILVNDEFFAMGGATEQQLRKKLETLKQ